MKTLNNIEFQELKAFIQKNEIDPRFLNYGGFVYEIKPKSYKKEYREEMNKYAGMYKIFTDTNLYTLHPNDGHDLILTEQQKTEILPVIEKRQETKYYKDAFNTLYNCYGYEYTIYSDDFENRLMSQDWWLTVKPSKLIHLNAPKKEDKELKEEVIKQCEEQVKFLNNKGIKVLGFEISKKYELIHFTKEEFKYIVNEIVKDYKGVNKDYHPTHQLTRRTKKDISHRIKDFKEYTLEPTKRKVLLDVHTYGITYVELSKIYKFD